MFCIEVQQHRMQHITTRLKHTTIRLEPYTKPYFTQRVQYNLPLNRTFIKHMRRIQAYDMSRQISVYCNAL